MSNIPTSQKTIVGQIFDASGHTDFSGTLEEAMETIMHQVTKAGKWVYLNGNPFMFTNYDLAEQNEVRNMLANAEEPTFILTAKLQGGSKAKYNAKVTKTPLSKILNSNNRAQLAVTVKRQGGKEYVDVLVSDYNGAKAKLSKHRAAILARVFDLLNPDQKGK